MTASYTKYKILDLFSGIGMFSYDLHKTGLYETEAFCEWDEPCRNVLSKNFPNIPIFKDVKDLTSDQLNFSPDIIVGGFPCQDISVAGKGVGIESADRDWEVLT